MDITSVDITSVAINHFYGLLGIAEDEFSSIMQQSPFFAEISIALPGVDIGLLSNWHRIPRGQLTIGAKSCAGHLNLKNTAQSGHTDIHHHNISHRRHGPGY